MQFKQCKKSLYEPEPASHLLSLTKGQPVCRKAVITTRILGLVHELCVKRIHVTKRDLFYTDVKLFEVRIILSPLFFTTSMAVKFNHKP